jgi:glycine/D-amino acid oxidase-like deaminating enzyme
MTRVVVVGAGLLGSAVADELAGAGAEVTVLEADRPAAGASGASFAWLNAQDKAPAGYFELNLAGLRAWPELARELGGSWHHAGGDVAVGRGPGAAKVAEKIERHRAAGYPVREIDRAELARLEPDLAIPHGGELTIAHFPDDAWIDAPAAVAQRLARARERGATVHTGRAVAGYDLEGGRVTAVRTSDGGVPADVVVLAAGTASERLAGEAGVALPMSPSPGVLVTTAPTTARVSHIVHAGDVAFRPDGGGRLVLQSRAIDADLDPGVRSMGADEPPVSALLERGASVLPPLGGVAAQGVRIGVRSVAKDGLPVAGFAPGIDNLYLLVSHSGVTLAPVLGRLVAAELTGSPEDRLAPYRPDRFAEGGG